MAPTIVEPKVRPAPAPSRLFVPLPPGRGISPLLAVVGVVAGAVASLLRQGGIPAWDSVWAEDGTATLHDAVSGSLWHALSTPVSGYYQTLPRLLAAPVPYLPATWAAPLFAVEAAGVTALFALFVYVASEAHLRAPLARLAAAGVAVLTPVGMQDVPNSLCNLHWAGMYAVFWALLYVPRGRSGQVAAVAVVLLVALTNLLVVVFLPLAVVRLVRCRRAPYTVVLFLGTAAGLAVQAVGQLTGAAATREVPSHPLPRAAFDGFFTAVVPHALLGEVLAPQPAGPLAAWLLPLCVWAGVVITGVVAVGFAAPNWPVAWLLAGHALLFWTVAAGTTGLFVTRYETTPAMLLVAAVAALVRPGPAGAPLVAFVLLVTVVWTVNYRVPDLRADGPSWRATVASARASCGRPGVTTVTVPIAPVVDPHWVVPLRCDYLRRRWR